MTIEQMTIDQSINEFFAPVAGKVAEIVFWGPEVAGMTLPFLVLWLALGGIFFSFYLGSTHTDRYVIQ